MPSTQAPRTLRLAALSAGAVLGVGLALAGANAWVALASRGRVRGWRDPAPRPAGAASGAAPGSDPSGGSGLGAPEAGPATVAIVLGAEVWPGGAPSPWLAYRLDLAAGLHRAGRVGVVIVSGDGRRAWRDEPAVMRDYLVRIGVPEHAVVLDPGGLDTYDTCVRARRVLGVTRAVLVSQDFHLPRAVAIARAVGIDAVGEADLLARRRSPRRWRSSWLRERPAAVKAAWDVLSRRAPALGLAHAAASSGRESAQERREDPPAHQRASALAHWRSVEEACERPGRTAGPAWHSR